MRLSALLVLAASACSYISEQDLAARMDLDGDGLARPDDCDDADPEVTLFTFYLDADGDGFGGGTVEQGCVAPAGYVAADGDCDDGDAAVFPGAEEACNGIDDDCDDEADEGLELRTYYLDVDGDGYGGTAISEQACGPSSNYVDNADDCDDADDDIHPEAVELCDPDDVDEDCDGLVDDADDLIDDSTLVTVYRDDDGDGYGEDDETSQACDAGEGWALVAGDCDDDDPALNPDTTWYRDADDDGYGDGDYTTRACLDVEGYVLNEQDCDDAHAHVHPAGQEVCDDLDLDEDCDGAIDDADDSVAGQLTIYEDVDGDGYGDDATETLACDVWSGWGLVGQDCYPTDPAANPAGTEVWYDGIDQDCDGWSDYDADGDGYDLDSYGGADCDDADPSVNPDATEFCGDGIDNDCDGSTMGVCALNGESRLADADVSLLGEHPTYQFVGESLALGDLDGDGASDLLIGATRLDLTGSYTGGGGAYIVYGPVTDAGSLGSYGVPLVSSDAYSDAGSVVLLSDDLDGDGQRDVVIGAPFSDAAGYSDGGRVYLASGAPTAQVALETSAAIIHPTEDNQYLGMDLAVLADRDADGSAELVIGNYLAGGGAGAVHLFRGVPDQSQSIDQADLSITGQAGEYFGKAVENAGDLDGDGLDDLAVGASGYVSSTRQNAILVFHDPLGATASDDYDGLFYSAASSTELGHHLAAAGDLDGDGLADLLIGDRVYDGNRGAVYVALGPATGSSTVASLTDRIEGANSDDWAGGFASPGGDLNGDGHADLAIGADNAHDSAGDQTGAAYLLLGPISGVLSLGTASGSLVGESAGGMNVESVAAGGDLDLDGFDDVVIGVPGYASSYGGGDEGAVFVFFAGPE
jgi:hypothetical protein